MNDTISGDSKLWPIFACGIGGLGWFPFGKPRRRMDILQGVDIEAEYRLIKEKRSGLSANQRREVVRRYERERQCAGHTSH